MKEKNVLPLLISLALPMVISMLINSLYNIVDSFFVAQISEDAMTALSLVFPVQNFINAVSIGFGVGINAVIAFCLGAGQPRLAHMAATHGMVLSGVHGIILTVAALLVMPPFLRMFTASDEVVQMGLQYSVIVFSFALITVLGISFEKIFQSVGNMKVPMISLSCGCIVNIILDPLLIFGIGPFPRLGIDGAAWATVIGQVSSLFIYSVVYVKRPISVQIHRRYLLPDRTLDGKLYGIGIPATLNMALPSLLIAALNGLLAASQSYVVILGIYYKLQTFLYLPANEFIQGMRPLIGYNFGAGEQERVRLIYLTTLGMTGLIMLAGTILCQFFPAELMGLFTDNGETIMDGQAALRIISAGFIMSAVSVTSSGALEGLGKGAPSFVISLLRYTVISIPTAYLLVRVMEPTGIWHAFWLSEAVTAVLAFFIYRRTAEKKDRHTVADYPDFPWHIGPENGVQVAVLGNAAAA
jgi:putative MATE family efflux protein